MDFENANFSGTEVTISPTHSPPKNDAFENLFPALLECFAIIFAGFFAGRISLISQQQGKGLSVFVSKFAQPALLFKSMCELNFGDVDWLFLLSVFIGKSIVFIVVVVLTIILLRPVHFGKVGIYGIFVTQSHDFALGIPIVRALYSTTHPDYEKYLYLIAPISVAILNPIGFLLMEVHKWRRSSTGRQRGQTKCRAFAQVLAGVATNPIVFMTALGIIGNFVFKQKIPSYLDNILVVLSESFAATALFCLGHSMVFKAASSMKGNLVTISLLIAAKMLISPLLIRELVHITHPSTNATELVDLSTYGFLYGTFPTAPSVYIYAMLYSVQAQLMAAGMVISTFLSAPVIYISARLMTLPVTSEEMYRSLILSTARDISILGVVSCVWVLVVFVIHKRVRMVPHKFTTCLVISQIIGCIGIIIRSWTDSMVPWQHYLQFIPYFIGITATRCWMSCVAVCLCLLKAKSLCFVLKKKAYFYFWGFGIPTLLCGLLFIAAKQDHMNKDDPCYMFGAYGPTQGILSVVVLIVNAIITIIALVVSKRADKTRQRFESECSVPDCPRVSEPSSPVAAGRRTYGTDSVAASAPATMGWMENHASATASERNQGDTAAARKGKKVKVKKTKEQCSDCNTGCESKNAVRNIEDIVPDVRDRRNPTGALSETTNSEVSGDDDETQNLLSSSRPRRSLYNPRLGKSDCGQQNCAPEERQRCETLLRSYENIYNVSDDDPIEETSAPIDFQEMRHTILLLLLLTSCIEGVFLLVWRLLRETENGVFVELEFLDTFLMFGQGFFSFLIFGLDQKMVIEPFMRRIAKIIDKRKKPIMKRSYSELDQETIHTCEQFTSYHMKRCKQEIAEDKMFHLQLYKDVFSGSELVSWLMEVGVAQERSDGVSYGRRLLEGAVIEHVTGNHHFEDMRYLYRLCDSGLNSNTERTDTDNDEGHQLSGSNGSTQVPNTTTSILVHTE